MLGNQTKFFVLSDYGDCAKYFIVGQEDGESVRVDFCELHNCETEFFVRLACPCEVA